ncbi:GTPase Era [Polystyrenella longa]|uniref:GTPase Era n=1 Tax=Polystyrenella longa TaxID=2528007 RepID=A0A518CRP4_9PLAN|nr:GTPase domain-containing protein [Polystyrenella longa]QDU81906.1 GTPase Era [Polystyrenella longa]
MSSPRIDQIELLTRIDELTTQLRRWIDVEHAWEPLQHSQNLLKQLLSRAEDLRLRIEQPLVVATFGGTGTGKSTLVNALIGSEVSRTGKQRPTTRRPVLLVHPSTDPTHLSFPIHDFEVEVVDSPLLQDIVLVDCPDPDTDESAAHESNLARLHRMIPYCDVLIYTTTQQKYRSSRVKDELIQAAVGCRLLFVQSHADLDEDIRDDWRGQLEQNYAVPELFLVDSITGLQEQQRGLPLTGDFGRLYETIQSELSASHRQRIRRANLLDLLQAGVDRGLDNLHDHLVALRNLESALEQEQQKVAQTLTSNLTGELQSSRGLWERRLLNSVAEIWGIGPFALVLRLYNSLGNLAASLTFFRARSTAQMAIIGTLQGMRWIKSKQAEQSSESQAERLSSMGIDDDLLRESQIVVSGYAQEAGFNPQEIKDFSFDNLQHDAARVESRFLADVGIQIDDLIERIAKRNSGKLTRFIYETLWSAYLFFVLLRIGENFFIDSFFYEAPLLRMEFYIAAGIFLILWSGVLVIALTLQIRRGLNREIEQLADNLARKKLTSPLYPELATACHSAHQQLHQLEHLKQKTEEARKLLSDQSSLGGTHVRNVPTR